MTLLERHTFPTFAHTFMNLVRNSSNGRRCLDCGAGGERPPVALFSHLGYEVVGIDIDKDRLKMAEDFCKQEGLSVEFRIGDMRELDLPDESFSSVFSYNTICHLSREDTAIALKEMIRVLLSGGFLFVNFLSVDDFRFGQGEEVAPNEYVNQSLHMFYEDDEPDDLFEETDILWKLKWIEQSSHEGSWLTGATLAYLAQKK